MVELCYVMIALCYGLRGKEVPLTALNGLLHFWEKTRLAAQFHIMIDLFS